MFKHRLAAFDWVELHSGVRQLGHGDGKEACPLSGGNHRQYGSGALRFLNHAWTDFGFSAEVIK